MNLNIIITGVGGQGTVSLGHLLGKIAKESGFNVIAAETHGMSQRGGSVVFHLKIGDYRSPLIPKGHADAIISGEPMEALRVIDFLKPNGVVITNTHTILSPVAIQLGMFYPDLTDIINALEDWPAKVYSMNTGSIIQEIDVKKGENLILLGVFVSLGILDVDNKTIEKIIIKRWPKVAESNLKALKAGYKLIENYNQISV